MPITVKHTKVSAIPDAGDANLVQPSDWNADHTLVGLGTMAEQNANNVAITGGAISGVTLPASNITGTLGVPNGGTGATTLTGYVKGAGTTALTASSTIPNTDITGLGTASTKDAGVALGVATLDAGGKVPISELPAAVLGALSYQGTWDASTNTPTLTSSVGTKGYYYVVSVAGNTNLNGITDWLVGDWAVYNGTVWQKVDNTETVTSVNGQTGAVVLTTTNIAEGTNEYFTTARARQSLSAGTGISYDNSTGVITNSSPSLGGDVVGPASATDNAIARFDTTTGKLIQNSVVTVSDTGDVAGATTITDINYVDFNTAYSTALTAGQLGWDGNNTLALGMAGGNVIQHIGEDSYFYIKASSAITKGQLVMFTGAVGASGVLTGAPSTGVTNPSYIMGVAAETLALNDFGLVQCFGELTNVNTNSFNEGDVLYYDSAVTGGLTNVFPTSGIIVEVAAVAKKSAGGGVIYIRVGKTDRITASTGISVSQTSTGVTVTNSAPDQTVSLTGGTGISTSGTYPNFTITNTAPDQTVSLTAGTGISVSGTYPSFTVANTGVTSVTGTAPVVSSGGATPAISMAKATGSVDGYLSSTDWTIFNNKQPAGTYVTSVSGTSGRITSSGGTTPAIDLASGIVTAGTTGSSTLIPVITVDTYGRVTSITTASNPQGTVTSVTGTAPIASSGGATPAISIPKATGSVDGYLSSTDWTTFNNKGSGTVTSVSALTLGTTGTDLSSTVANGTTTPVITLNVPTASATNRGALSSTDWTTFNSKAPAVTYTTNYVPYGQGTTTPNQSANFTYNGTTLTAQIVRASNGLHVNSQTVSASYTIASGDSAMSAGPVTVASGQSVTISSGSRWVVL